MGKTFKDYIDECVYAVEANSTEEMYIWERFCGPNSAWGPEKRIKWEQDFGWLETVGHLDDSPICISIFIHKLDGYPVLFWHATSQLVDYVMIDEWFRERAPHLQQTDAMSIHHALHHIEDLKKEAG